MNDFLSFILFMVLFNVLKPIIKAILCGFGNSDHNRDRKQE